MLAALKCMLAWFALMPVLMWSAALPWAKACGAGPFIEARCCMITFKWLSACTPTIAVAPTPCA